MRLSSIIWCVRYTLADHLIRWAAFIMPPFDFDTDGSDKMDDSLESD